MSINSSMVFPRRIQFVYIRDEHRCRHRRRSQEAKVLSGGDLKKRRALEAFLKSLFFADGEEDIEVGFANGEQFCMVSLGQTYGSN